MAGGLAFLHKNKIIYRDLKPGNILILLVNLVASVSCLKHIVTDSHFYLPCVQVNAKLSDYGIAAFTTEGGLQQEIGTPGYKAPELLKAKASQMTYDEKVCTPSFLATLNFYLFDTFTCMMSLLHHHLQVDIYSYGIVLFQLITSGHTPFEELSVHERDRAVEQVPKESHVLIQLFILMQGQPIRPVSHYGCPPWLDMQDLITDCLQYLTINRPKVSHCVI